MALRRMQPHELWPSPPHQQHPVLGGRTSQRASYAGRNKLAPQTNVAFDGVANHSDSDPLRLCMTNVFQAYITHLLTRSFFLQCSQNGRMTRCFVPFAAAAGAGAGAHAKATAGTVRGAGAGAAEIWIFWSIVCSIEIMPFHAYAFTMGHRGNGG